MKSIPYTLLNIKKPLLHLLITKRLKLNELTATLSQDIGLIFEAINDAVYFVFVKTAIEFFDSVEVAGIGEEYRGAFLGHGIVFDVKAVVGGAKIRSQKLVELVAEVGIAKKSREHLAFLIVGHEIEVFVVSVKKKIMLGLFRKYLACKVHGIGKNQTFDRAQKVWRGQTIMAQET